MMAPTNKLISILSYFVLVVTAFGQLDNHDTCAHRVLNCDPNVDHFETKISMDHSSSVTTLQYENTHVLLEQSWPTRGPWMKETTQKVVFIRCGCPIPALSSDWNDANIIHVPVSSVMVQMPTTLSKLYLIGQRSKVKAVESNRYISDATPEIATDLRDGIIQRLDLSPNGTPSTMITLSFTGGSFSNDTSGFRLLLIDNADLSVQASTECIFPGADASTLDHLDVVMDTAFNSVPGWVSAGKVWVLTKGSASDKPSTSLSYTLYFDNQLPMGLSLSGEASPCNGDVEVKVQRDFASSRHPIYHRLNDLPGGFPDVLITEPRSLGPLADDPKIAARRFIDSDPGEATPLARAELMKLLALITGSEHTANNLFETIETRYMDAKALAMKAHSRPTVMLGKPGTWNEAARNSWMITVGSTYIGQFLRDANVEYRNTDDDINNEICGTGCGVCPSGSSDTRCSVPIMKYLDLFKSADYWISAGIGANCWSASCNFQITSDSLLDQNRPIFKEFLSMRCGSVIGLDKAHSGSGNPYWETGRIRPDIVLMDLVTLMHPDLDIQKETTFFRMLPPASNLDGVESCPRTLLLPKPGSGAVYVTSGFIIDMSTPSFDIIGPPRFAIMERFSNGSNNIVADNLGVDVSDLEIVTSNGSMKHEQSFGITVTVRVSGCFVGNSCAVNVGQKLDEGGTVSGIQDAIGLNWVNVSRDSLRPVHVMDAQGDVIPLENLVTSDSPPDDDEDTKKNDDVNKGTDGLTGERNGSNGLGSGEIAGIVVGVLGGFLIGMFATYRLGRAQGAKYRDPQQQQGTEVFTHA